MARITQRPAARRDLMHHFVYLTEHAGLETAQRFRQAAQETYAELAEMPQIGVSGKVRQGRFADVRLWRVRGFENYLIF
jgi:toxin ParE1/3/4